MDRDQRSLRADIARSETFALVVEYELPGLGRFSLQTCLLPGGDHLYLLPLELARQRIMMIIRKLEEWALSDLSPEDEVMRHFDDAREQFTAAMTAPRGNDRGFSSEAIAAAERSLRLAIEAGEMLTRLDARQHRHATVESVTSPPPRVGVSLQPEVFAEPHRAAVLNKFDFVSCPMNWRSMEVEEGRYQYTDTDRCIEWAVRSARVPIIGGPIIEFSDAAMPDWLGIWEHDYEQLRDFAYAHIKRIVTRYRRTVSTWIATSCLSDNISIALSLEQMIDMTRLAVLAIRKLHPNAAILVELAHPFGDRLNHDKPGEPPRLFAEFLVETGVRFDGIALRLVMGDRSPGRSRRDLLTIAHTLDHLAVLEKPVHISRLGVPSGPRPGDPPVDPPLTAQSQAEWAQQLIDIITARPYVRSVCWQGLADTESPAFLQSGGLLDVRSVAKPVYEVLTGARKPAAPAAPATP